MWPVTAVGGDGLLLFPLPYRPMAVVVSLFVRTFSVAVSDLASSVQILDFTTRWPVTEEVDWPAWCLDSPKSGYRFDTGYYVASVLLSMM